jgi:serine/threonine protein kinase
VSILEQFLFIVTDHLQSNILIDDNGGANITDFGLSRILEASGFTTKTAAGTYRYMAPELYSDCEEDDGYLPRATVATDVWAYSMTAIEVRVSTVSAFLLAS